MFTRITRPIVIALPLGVLGVHSHALAAQPQSPAQPAPTSQPTQGDDRASTEMSSWIRAWNNLEPTQQRALVQSVKNVTGNIEGLTPEQMQRLDRALDTLAQSLSQAREMTPEQQQAVRDAVAQLKTTFMALSPEQRSSLLERIGAGMQEAGSPAPQSPDAP